MSTFTVMHQKPQSRKLFRLEINGNRILVAIHHRDPNGGVIFFYSKKEGGIF